MTEKQIYGLLEAVWAFFFNIPEFQFAFRVAFNLFIQSGTYKVNHSEERSSFAHVLGDLLLDNNMLQEKCLVNFT